MSRFISLATCAFEKLLAEDLEKAGYRGFSCSRAREGRTSASQATEDASHSPEAPAKSDNPQAWQFCNSGSCAPPPRRRSLRSTDLSDRGALDHAGCMDSPHVCRLSIRALKSSVSFDRCQMHLRSKHAVTAATETRSRSIGGESSAWLCVKMTQIKAPYLGFDQTVAMWNPVASAPFGQDLQLAVIDQDGVHALVFACQRERGGGWRNVVTGAPVDIRPTHWRLWDFELVGDSPVRSN